MIQHHSNEGPHLTHSSVNSSLLPSSQPYSPIPMWVLPAISKNEIQDKSYFPTMKKSFWNLTQVCLLHVSENLTSYDVVI